MKIQHRNASITAHELWKYPFSFICHNDLKPIMPLSTLYLYHISLVILMRIKPRNAPTNPLGTWMPSHLSITFHQDQDSLILTTLGWKALRPPANLRGTREPTSLALLVAFACAPGRKKRKGKENLLREEVNIKWGRGSKDRQEGNADEMSKWKENGK